MHMLWIKFYNHPNLKHIANDFYDQELSFRLEMSVLPPGSTEWCMCEMNRHLLFRQCKKECIEYLHKVPTHSDVCNKCGLVYFIDSTTCTKICKGCGLSFDFLLDDGGGYSTKDLYNGNRRHHYNPTEHFIQTVCDFTGTGNRRVPVDVFSYCRGVLGRGLHVTSHNVFLTLQMGGYGAYYMHKYDIANRLRGKREFVVSSREIRQMKEVYMRYRREFIPFQQAHYIGTFSKTGKPRIYWPMRYILKKICEEIGRSDLTSYIRAVCDKGKIDLYDKYWYMLKGFIDNSRPKRDQTDYSLGAIQLCPR